MPPEAGPAANGWSPAVDAHAHILDPGLPLAPGATHAPIRAITAEDYLAVLDDHGVSFGVLTAVSSFGTRNDYTRVALEAHPRRLRGTAIVDPEIDLSELRALDRAGFVGIRFSLRGYPTVPDLNDPAYRRLLHRVTDLGWHVHVLAEPERAAVLVPQLVESGVDLVLDHFGAPDGKLGYRCPGYQAMLRAIDSGRTWVKLSGPFRSRDIDPPALARTLLSKAGPERLVWGSDWPWMPFEGRFKYADCIRWMVEWLPDPVIRKEIDFTALKLFRFV